MTSPFTIREEDAGFRVYCFSAGMYPIGSREDAERLKRSLDYEWARHNPTDDDIRSFLEVFDQRDQALADLAKERERLKRYESIANPAKVAIECMAERDALRAELAECRAELERAKREADLPGGTRSVVYWNRLFLAAEARAERYEAVVNRMAKHGSCACFEGSFAEQRFVGCELYRSDDTEEYCLRCDALAAIAETEKEKP